MSGERAANARIFISYSRKDMAFVDRLEPALRERGFEPLIDRTEIYAFEDWWERIKSLITNADTILFVLSPNAVASNVAMKEVVFAASLNKRFAPVVHLRVDDRELPEELQRLNFIFFDVESEFDTSIGRLCEALATDIEWVRKHTEYGGQSLRWSEAGRRQSRGLLLRSPMLEEAEQWIATRPRGAPDPTEATQAFIAESRRAATRRRNVLTGSLAAGLFLSLGLAGLAYWQRGIAVDALEQAERNYTLAVESAAKNVEVIESLANSPGITKEAAAKILNVSRDIFTKLLSGRENDAAILAQVHLFEALTKSYLSLGNVQEALDTAASGNLNATRMAKQKNANGSWQRIAADTFRTLGDVQRRMGNLGGALEAYQASNKAFVTLSQADQQDDKLKREAAYSFQLIGDIQRRQGLLEAALAAYETSLPTLTRLQQQDPSNTDWRWALAANYERLGNLHRQQGDFGSALREFKIYRSHFVELTNQEKSNTGWQRELGLGSEKIGDMLQALGDIDGALKSFEDCRDVYVRLTSVDTSNVVWKNDLAFSYQKLGHIRLARNDAEGALALYRQNRELISDLVKQDGFNLNWKQDEAIAYAFSGDAMFAQGKFAEALDAYRIFRDMTDRLVRRDSSNTTWQYHLALGYQRVGQSLRAMGNVDGAKREFSECSRIAITGVGNPLIAEPKDPKGYCLRQIEQIEAQPPSHQ